MNYYNYTPGCEAPTIAAPLEEHKRIVNLHFDDQPVLSSWRPLLFHGFEEDENRERPDVHFPSANDYCDIPIFSQHAWDVLSLAIDCQWEALPIIYPGGRTYYLIHVMETINCVDLSRSSVARYDDGEVSQIERYFLTTELLAGKHVFKTPLEIGRELIVDDMFREAVENNGLDGLDFRPLPRVAQ